MILHPNFREFLFQKLSDNSRRASLWTLKGAKNVARGAVSRPFVLQTQALEGARTIYQTVSPRTRVNKPSAQARDPVRD